MNRRSSEPADLPHRLARMVGLPLLIVGCSARVSTVGPDAATDAVVDERPCTPDVPWSCPCANGARGVARCDVYGTPGVCVCPPAPMTFCIPGVQMSCPCPNTSGLQLCAPDGNSWGPCVCPVIPAYTYDYVIYRLHLNSASEPPGNQGVAGFNLDGRYSPALVASQTALDCGHGDHFSALDPDQDMGTCAPGSPGGGPSCRGGVDNQLPVVAQTLRQYQSSIDLGSALNEPLARGRGLILMRVSDVNGWPQPGLNDDTVTVRLYPNAHAMFADCRSVGFPRAMYAVDDRSLNVPGDLSSARLQFSAVIVNGRLRVAPTAGSAPALRLAATLMGADLPIDIRGARFRFTLDEVDVVGGNLGGYTTAADLLDSLGRVPALRDFRDAAGPLVQGFVDVATDGSAATCEGPDGRIGVGLRFDAARATIAPTTVSEAPPGSCGR